VGLASTSSVTCRTFHSPFVITRTLREPIVIRGMRHLRPRLAWHYDLMPLDPNEVEELALYFMECLRMSVLEVLERLPKPKCARPTEWTKDDRKRIELPIAAKVMEGYSSD
jgi:hypothetical protein